MALQRGTKVGGEFLSLEEEASAGPVLMIFRLVEFETPEMGDYQALKCPVIADVLICSGPHKGQVHPGERFFGAPSGPLRGVKNPKKGEPALDPVTHLGDELAFRVSFVDRKGSNSFVALDPPSDPEMDAIAAVYADGAGWDGAPAKQLVGAGAGAPAANGTKRPWG
jgi:hypothetical protein